MKNSVITMLFIALSFILGFSQAPQAFNYQGLAASSLNGSPIRNKSISIEASILKGSLDLDDVVYTETHQVQTDRFGFFSIVIGEGQLVEGTFSTITWGADNHFLQIGMDRNGGSNFSTLGKTQLLSVPYALHAGNGSRWEETDSGIIYEPISINKQNDGKIEFNGDQDIPELQNFETIFSSKVDNGNSNDYLAIINATKLENQFIPSMQGHHTTDNRQALNLGASTTPNFDVQSNTPLMTFSSRIRSGTQTSNVQNRILFGWQNRLETKMVLSAQGNLGIGTIEPSNIFHIDLEQSGNLFEKGISITRNNGFLKLMNGTQLNGQFQARISGRADSNLSPGLTLVGTPSSTDSNTRGIVLRAGEENKINSGNLIEIDNFTDTKVVISHEGNIGIGTDEPSAKLEVTDGDIYINDLNKGVIMKSPNGNCWRMTVNDNGQPVFTQITCP